MTAPTGNVDSAREDQADLERLAAEPWLTIPN
jgi:hypothetical protein